MRVRWITGNELPVGVTRSVLFCPFVLGMTDDRQYVLRVRVTLDPQ